VFSKTSKLVYYKSRHEVSKYLLAKYTYNTKLSFVTSVFLVCVTIATGEVGSFRNLLSSRSGDASESSDSDRRSLGLKKIAKRVSKKANKIVNVVVSETSKQAQSVKRVFSGAVLPRSASFLNKMKNELSSGTMSSWKDLTNGFNSIDNYVDNQLVKDLEWLGDSLKDAWEDGFCELPGGPAALTTVCAFALNAGVCTAMNGVAPYCGPSQGLIKAVTDALSVATVRAALSCSSYHALKGSVKCKGIAMSAGDMMATSLIADPYTPVCSAGVQCSCGSCPFQCSYSVNPICEGSQWKDAVKAIAKAVVELAN